MGMGAQCAGNAASEVTSQGLPRQLVLDAGPARIAAEWRSEQAASLRRVLENATEYPHCGRYRAWPGPNSNTFAAWVLRRAGVEHKLPWKALGSNF